MTLFLEIWRKGELTGKGILTLKNKEVYEGDFLNGIKEGEGKYRFKNGDCYVGSWKKGQPNGWGITLIVFL